MSSRQAAGWGLLPASIDGALLDEAFSRFKRKRRFIDDAGLQVSSAPDGSARLRIRSRPRPPKLAYLARLQRADGSFVQELDSLLERDTFGVDLRDALDEFYEKYEQIPREWIAASPLAEQQLQLWQADDTAAALREFAEENQSFRLYRIGTHPQFSARQTVFQVLGDLAQGIPPEDLVVGTARDEGYLLRGQISIGPSGLICPPMLARNQPLATVFVTRNGAQIIGVSSGAIHRPVRMPNNVLTGWQGFGGTGDAAYRTPDRKIPEYWAESLLRALAGGVSRLLDLTTDPGRWVNGEGYFDNDSREMAWSNVLMGLDAVAAVGEYWHDTSEALWAAFRALTTLQGLWEATGVTVPLTLVGRQNLMGATLS